MYKYTISISAEQKRTIDVVKAVHQLNNISDTVDFIVKDYSKKEYYKKFISKKLGVNVGKK